MRAYVFFGSDGDQFTLCEAPGGDGAGGERVDPGEAALLVAQGLLDDMQVAAWEEPLEPEHVAAEFARGATSRWVLLRREKARLKIDADFEEHVTDLADLVDDDPPQPDTKKRSFELRLVDEMGEAVDGIDIELSVDNSPRSLTTDGDGVVKVDDAELSNANARIKDIAQLRDALQPRWETIRDGDWVDDKEHHSYIDCSDPLPVIALRSDTPHTVVVQPQVVCARLIGMFFDTSKSFLLPKALVHIRSIRKLYDDRPDADVLIVGHTDTSGQPSYNDPLSLERADAVRAYLRDDVDAWLDWYDSGKPYEKRWGSREDNLMLTAVLAESGETPAEPPMKHFQRTRGLSVDGIAGPQTRTQLITEYMGFDDTTLPGGIEPVVHGCGENFPVSESGDLDTQAADGKSEDDDRRVELFFFDGQLGVLPPPPGDNSSPDSPEYPEWRRRSRETHDFGTGAHRLSRVRVVDENREPIPNAPCRYPATGVSAVADDEGFIDLDDGIAGEACDLEWTKPGQEGQEPWPFSRRVFVHFPGGDESDKRKLHNVGYLISDGLEANVMSFEVDFDFVPSGELPNISASLNAWHDGGEKPDPNAPPPPPPPSDKETTGIDAVATASGNKTTTKLLVGVVDDGVSASNPMDKSLHSVTVVPSAGGKALKHKKVLTDKRGGLIFQFLDVKEDNYDITARRKNSDGDVERMVTKVGFHVGLDKEHEAVRVKLGAAASFAQFTDKPGKFGFDTFTGGPSKPIMSMEKGKNDAVKVTVFPPESFAQCTFHATSSNIKVVGPLRAKGATTTVTLEGKSVGDAKMEVRRDGVAIGTLFVEVFERKTKTVGVRLVHHPKRASEDISDAVIKNALNKYFESAIMSFHRSSGSAR